MAEPIFVLEGIDYDDCYVNLYTVSDNMVGINIGVKITHTPSGLTAKCGSERGEWMNRNIALRELSKLVAAGYQLPLF